MDWPELQGGGVYGGIGGGVYAPGGGATKLSWMHWGSLSLGAPQERWQGAGAGAGGKEGGVPTT